MPATDHSRHPAWFGAVMGTGALALAVSAQAGVWGWGWLAPVAIALLLLATAQSVLLLPRYVRPAQDRTALHDEFVDPARGPLLALSEMNDNVLADHLMTALGSAGGSATAGRGGPAGFEIDGVDDRLLAEFSTRVTGIDARYSQLRAAFRAEHGMEPSDAQAMALRQQATLETRPDKQVRRLGDQLVEWRRRAEAVTGRTPRDIAAAALGGGKPAALAHDQVSPATVARLAAVVLEDVAARRAVFNTWAIRAEVQPATRGLRMTTAGDRIALTDRVAAAVSSLARPEGRRARALRKGAHTVVVRSKTHEPRSPGNDPRRPPRQRRAAARPGGLWPLCGLVFVDDA